MKRLLVLRDAEQEMAIRQLMASHRIEVSESEVNFLDEASLWVRDEDYPRATELLEDQVTSDARERRLESKREWTEHWGGSYVRWFLRAMTAHPQRIFRLILLILIVWLVALSPLWTALRSRW